MNPNELASTSGHHSCSALFRRNLFFSTLLATASFLAANSPVLGQTAVYSDGWISQGATADTGTITGIGVTEDDNNYYGNSYWVVTTLRSPNGRVATATSQANSSYAEANANLALDWNDIGEYTVDSEHWFSDSEGSYVIGYSQIRQQVGFSQAIYRLTARLGNQGHSTAYRPAVSVVRAPQVSREDLSVQA